MTARTCDAPGVGIIAPATIVACGEAAAATVTFACLHEHITQSDVCFACACDIQQYAIGMACPECYDADGHTCWSAVTITWDDGTITAVQDTAGRNLL